MDNNLNNLNTSLKDGMSSTVLYKKVKFRTKVSGSILFYTLRIPNRDQLYGSVHPWKLLQNVLYTILYKLVKKSEPKDEILTHSFHLDNNLGKFPQYKIALQTILSELEEDHKFSTDNYLFFAIQAD